MTLNSRLRSLFAIVRTTATKALRNPRITRRIRSILTVATVAYLSAILFAGLNDLRAIEWVPYVRAMIISFLLYPLALVVQALAWAIGTGYLRERSWACSWTDIQVFARSFLLRRLPGGFWQIAGRVIAYRDRGVQVSQPIAVSAAEVALTVATAGGLFVGFGPLLSTNLATGSIVAIGLSAVSGLMTGQAISRLRLLRHSPFRSPDYRTGSAVFATMALLYLAAIVVASIILKLMVDAGGRATFPLESAFAVWGVVVLASTALLLLPVGFGIREITLTIVLAPTVGRPVAVVIAVLLRLLFIAGDLVWGLALVALANRVTFSSSDT